MCTCVNNKDNCVDNEANLEKAIDYYRNNDYHILRQVDYILFVNNDTIYIDTEFKKNGKSARKIFPSENGVRLKRLKIDFHNGINGAMEPIGIKKIISSYYDISSVSIQFHNENNPMGKDLLILNIGDRAKVFYYLGSDEGLVTNTVNTKIDYPKLFCEETFTLRELYDNCDGEYLSDYPVTIIEEYSLVNSSFTKFSSLKYSKSIYPWQLIKEQFGSHSWVTENDDTYSFCTPVGYEYTDKIRELIEMDIHLRLEESKRDYEIAQEARREAERQRKIEDMRNYFLDNAIYFPDMIDDYKNPIKAEKKYTIGMDIILKIKLDKIGRCSGGDYKYYMYYEGFTNKAYLYSDDEDFVELDYPTYVWIKAKYVSREVSFFDKVVTYEFSDAELFMWEKIERY